MLQTVLTIVHVILAIVLIAIVLFQSGKTAGMSGSIAGGPETFFGKNKARTMDGMLAKLTGIVAILLIVTSFVLSIILK